MFDGIFEGIIQAVINGTVGWLTAFSEGEEDLGSAYESTSE